MSDLDRTAGPARHRTLGGDHEQDHGAPEFGTQRGDVDRPRVGLIRIAPQLNLDDHRGHHGAIASAQLDHGVRAIFRRDHLRQVDRPRLDVVMVELDPGAGPEQLRRELPAIAEQLDEDLMTA